MKRIALTIAVIISPLLNNAALGCGCVFMRNPTPEEIRAARLEAFNNAAAVFSGKVIVLDQNRVKFKVERIWKGDSIDESTMVIQEKRDDGTYIMTSCDYSFQLGEKYLIYAYDAHGELRTNVCSRTMVLKNADQEMNGLDEIRLPEVRSAELEVSLLVWAEI